MARTAATGSSASKVTATPYGRGAGIIGLDPGAVATYQVRGRKLEAPA